MKEKNEVKSAEVIELFQAIIKKQLSLSHIYIDLNSHGKLDVEIAEELLSRMNKLIGYLNPYFKHIFRVMGEDHHHNTNISV